MIKIKYKITNFLNIYPNDFWQIENDSYYFHDKIQNVFKITNGYLTQVFSHNKIKPDYAKRVKILNNIFYLNEATLILSDNQGNHLIKNFYRGNDFYSVIYKNHYIAFKDNNSFLEPFYKEPVDFYEPNSHVISASHDHTKYTGIIKSFDMIFNQKNATIYFNSRLHPDKISTSPNGNTLALTTEENLSRIQFFKNFQFITALNVEGKIRHIKLFENIFFCFTELYIYVGNLD